MSDLANQPLSSDHRNLRGMTRRKFTAMALGTIGAVILGLKPETASATTLPTPTQVFHSWNYMNEQYPEVGWACVSNAMAVGNCGMTNTLGNLTALEHSIIMASGAKGTSSPYPSCERIAVTLIEGYSFSTDLTFIDLRNASDPTIYYGCYPPIAQSITYYPAVSTFLSLASRVASYLEAKLLSWGLTAANILYRLVSHSSGTNYVQSTFQRTFVLGGVDENAQFQYAEALFPQSNGFWSLQYIYTVITAAEGVLGSHLDINIWRGDEYAPTSARSQSNSEASYFVSKDGNGKDVHFEVTPRRTDYNIPLSSSASESEIYEVAEAHVKRSETIVRALSCVEDLGDPEATMLNKHVERLASLQNFIKENFSQDKRSARSVDDKRSELASIIPDFAVWK